jgi:Transposase DDE domain
MEACLDQVDPLPIGSRLLADKGYRSAKNEQLLRQRGLLNRPLYVWEKRYNQLIGRSRYKIERVFGSIKRWFGRLSARYVGLVKTHGQACLRGHGVVLERDDFTILGNWPPWLIFLPRSFKYSLALSPMVIVPCTSK